MLIVAKEAIKKMYKENYPFEATHIINFYSKLKTSNQLFFFLTNKDQEAVFLKFQIQKIIYYLIKILLRDKTKLTPLLSKDDRITILKIIKIIMMMNPYLAIIKLDYDLFLKYLFSLLNKDDKNEKLIKVSVNIIEAILVANNFMINLEYFPNLLDFFEGCLISEFSNFMRVIALIVLELNENKTEDFFELKLSLNDNVMLKNHCFLLLSNDFLQKCYKILYSISAIIETFYTSQTIKDFRRKWSILKSKTTHIEYSAINSEKFEKIISREHILSNLIHKLESIQFIIRNTNISELLFVVSNLLSGKRKIDVQNKLFALGFVDDILNPLFDILFEEGILHVNQPQMDEDDEFGDLNSDSLSTIRIQFLRIIINFSDRDTSNFDIKNSFISKQETNVLLTELLPKILQSYYYKYNTLEEKIELMKNEELNELLDYVSSQENEDYPLEIDFEKHNFNQVKNKGLILKVCNKLMGLPKNSPYRFWLASVIESFLRGFNPLHQIFVSCMGLISFLLKQLIVEKLMKTNNVQITFDLLGEIIKFNKVNIIILNKICKENNYQKILLPLMEKNIIDSNVFLRSMIMGFEKFRILCRNEENVFLKKYVMDFTDNIQINELTKKQETTWLKLLIKCIEPKGLNPDNICCINTALIICIISENYKKLEELLKDLKSTVYDEKQTLLDNFLNLLDVWQNYYMNKTKDCFGLQYSTNINFFHFKQMKSKINQFYRTK